MTEGNHRYAVSACFQPTQKVLLFLLIRLLKSHFPFLRKVRNLLVNPPDFIAEIINRSRRHRRSMSCLFSLFPELVLLVFLLFGFLGRSEGQSTRGVSDFIYFAFGQDVVDTRPTGLHQYVGGAVELEEELLGRLLVLVT